ncbi:hypothetical protein CAter282_4608 [Collimonas arenae]|uniref:Uncharacterized protein n=1 Tax=Collimonas arenae TaxID=279058 RepID=A0A127PXA3_9BURK|nr:hypothetical protein CAter10_5012 [Collimonas arenae]AMP12264.1 hypothetical protein CAter282_4608 [Collimonas arenae]
MRNQSAGDAGTHDHDIGRQVIGHVQPPAFKTAGCVTQ